MLGEEGERPLQGEVRARFVVAAALVAIEAVVGVVDINGHRRIGLFDLAYVVHRDVLILLAEMQYGGRLGLLRQHRRDAAAVIADGRLDARDSAGRGVGERTAPAIA